MSEGGGFGDIMERYMAALNLSQMKMAQEVLDKSPTWVSGALRGRNINTDGPFRPRGATLRDVAHRMNAYAESKGSNFRVTYEQLAHAAGLIKLEGSPPGRPEAIPPIEAMLPRGYIPWTPEEIEVITEAADLGVPLGGLTVPDFRRTAPEDREGTFSHWRQHLARSRAFREDEQRRMAGS